MNIIYEYPTHVTKNQHMSMKQELTHGMTSVMSDMNLLVLGVTSNIHSKMLIQGNGYCQSVLSIAPKKLIGHGLERYAIPSVNHTPLPLFLPTQ